MIILMIILTLILLMGAVVTCKAINNIIKNDENE